MGGFMGTITLSYLMRFRLELWDCDTIQDILNALDTIKKDLLFFESFGIEYENDGNDYHFFTIETNDQNLIDELKTRGFYELDE